MTFTLRKMTREEMPLAIEWAAREGWNPGFSDAGIFFDTDPNGFILGSLDGKPVGCVSAVSYGPAFGFAGFYIVCPQFRGHGYGTRLWRAAMEKLSSKTVGLDGVFEQQENYKKSGFRFAYRNIRYQYRTGEPLGNDGTAIVPASRVAFDQILEYDRQCFPAERRPFLEKWLRMPDAYAFARLEDSKLKGYGVIRRCRTGYKIGPLFSDDAVSARALFAQLCRTVQDGGPVYLDVPEGNPEGIRLAREFDMTQVFGTARMYLGPDPDIQLSKIFGVTTFELG